MGCILGGCTPERLSAATEYAGAIGLAFQIVDDILDVTGTAEALGKPVRSDLERDKATYVSLLGVGEAERETNRLTEKAVAALEVFGGEADGLRELAQQLAGRKS